MIAENALAAEQTRLQANCSRQQKFRSQSIVADLALR